MQQLMSGWIAHEFERSIAAPALDLAVNDRLPAIVNMIHERRTLNHAAGNRIRSHGRLHA
jgi:hypothetical protein